MYITASLGCLFPVETNMTCVIPSCVIPFFRITDDYK